jgi:hypothetical protein
VNSLSFTRIRQRYTDDTTLGGTGAAPARQGTQSKIG